jgi:DNA polymerase III alpha subunit
MAPSVALLTFTKQYLMASSQSYVSKQAATIKEPDNSKLFHQVVLCKDLQGWKSLLSMVSISNKIEHFYHKPRVGYDYFLELAAASNGKLVSFSGHLGSRLANVVVDNPNWKSEGIREAERLQEAFGKGNFYIEIQLIDSLINTKAKKLVKSCVRFLNLQEFHA